MTDTAQTVERIEPAINPLTPVVKFKLFEDWWVLPWIKGKTLGEYLTSLGLNLIGKSYNYTPGVTESKWFFETSTLKPETQVALDPRYKASNEHTNSPLVRLRLFDVWWVLPWLEGKTLEEYIKSIGLPSLERSMNYTPEKEPNWHGEYSTLIPGVYLMLDPSYYLEELKRLNASSQDQI